ncbi:MAG: hypothetical protein KAF40_10550 [Flavihumibacter sp.]|nr:hypothetical protein [Flavihumibacter sp.]
MSTIIEIKSKRWQSLVPLPFLLGIGITFYWFFWRNGSESLDAPTATFKWLSILVMGVSLFLFIYFVKTSIWPATILRVDEDGIIMNTGVSTQLMRWEEISKITETSIRATSGGGAPYRARVFAIQFKNPQQFRKRFNPIFRGSIRLSEAVNGVSLFIPFGYLENHYEEFKKLVERKMKIPVNEE